jgi:hypothetical protein
LIGSKLLIDYFSSYLVLFFFDERQLQIDFNIFLFFDDFGFSDVCVVSDFSNLASSIYALIDNLCIECLFLACFSIILFSFMYINFLNYSTKISSLFPYLFVI